MADTEMLYLRKASPADVDLVFEWANDRQTRENSFSTAHIEYDNHVAWYRNTLCSETRELYIMMKKNPDTGEESPVGQVRIDLEQDTAVISYSIAEAFRGHGYGKRIIELIVDEVRGNYPTIHRVTGQVKPGNTASNHIFRETGFKEQYIQYELEL